MDSEWDYCVALMADDHRKKEEAAKEAKTPISRQMAFGDLNFYVFAEIIKYLRLSELVKFERVCKRWASDIHSVPVDIKAADFNLENIFSEHTRSQAYLSIVKKFSKVRRFSFSMLDGHSRTQLRNCAARRTFCTQLASVQPSIEEFTDLEFDQHDDSERLKSVIMYCHAVGADHGSNSISRMAFNYKMLIRHPELLSQAITLCGKLSSVKILTELYAAQRSGQPLEEECPTINAMWQAIGPKLTNLSLGHYFSAAHDRGYFKLPVCHFKNLEQLSVNFLPPHYVQQLAEYCPKLRVLRLCSVTESLKYLKDLKNLETLEFRPTGGYFNGVQTSESLDQILHDFFKSASVRLRHLTFGKQYLRLPSLVYRTVSDHCKKLETLHLDMEIREVLEQPLQLPRLRTFTFQGPQLDTQSVLKFFCSCPSLRLINDASRHLRRDYSSRIELLNTLNSQVDMEQK